MKLNSIMVYDEVTKVVRYRAKSYKIISMALSYGASPKGLASIYGWRKVKETMRVIGL